MAAKQRRQARGSGCLLVPAPEAGREGREPLPAPPTLPAQPTPPEETLAGWSLSADCVGAHQYPRKANARQGLTVNSSREPLVFFQAVASGLGKQRVWAKIHMPAWRKNNMEKAAESKQYY